MRSTFERIRQGQADGRLHVPEAEVIFGIFVTSPFAEKKFKATEIVEHYKQLWDISSASLIASSVKSWTFLEQGENGSFGTRKIFQHNDL